MVFEPFEAAMIVLKVMGLMVVSSATTISSSTTL